MNGFSTGRVVMIGIPGPGLDPATRDWMARQRPGGVILFARNLESPESTMSLLAELARAVPHPLLLAIDQEGGPVSRIEPWTGPTPPAAEIARRGERAAHQFGAATGRSLRALGFNLDFAPVVDLCAADAANGIGSRSFGTDPEAATRLAGNFLEGLQSAGVAGCLKHFPGLGHTDVDSHRVLPTDRRPASEFERRDLVPYRELAGSAPAVMVGHAHYPELDPEPDRPASLSPPIVTGLLRQRLDFSGLVISDDLEMGAVAPRDEDGGAAVQAVGAGCELILYCSDLARAERGLSRLAERAATDGAFAARLAAAGNAVDRVARRWPAPAGTVARWEEARRELQGIA